MPNRASLHLLNLADDPLSVLERQVAVQANAAPAPVGQAMRDILASIRDTLDSLETPPELPRVPECLEGWPGLLAFLAEQRRVLDAALAAGPRPLGRCPSHHRLEQRFDSLKRAYENSALIIDIMVELITICDEFHRAEDFLEESAEILLKELGACLYVCRLKRMGADGEPVWENIASNTDDGHATPIFVKDLEETHPSHPVMRAVHEEPTRAYVLSNDLRGPERGGESFDCVPYMAGYRSRLSFILRDLDDTPFGLIMLYSRQSNYFDRYDSYLLGDCASLVSLILGRLFAMGQDALAKAAGGMAHVGNNVLGTLQGRVEIVLADLEELSAKLGITSGGEMEEIAEQVRYMFSDVDRLARAISKLEEAVERPVLMHYVRGRHVLDLEPDRSCDKPSWL
ncbi:MAG: hypothetical protein AB1916_09675 [Thermodesulfobacteriota bacterium]